MPKNSITPKNKAITKAAGGNTIQSIKNNNILVI